jgi:membrane fusion protein, multidrug efflux system
MMINKLNNMHIILKSLSIATLITLFVSCGDSRKEDKGELNDKKVKLEKLKGEQKKINDEIAQLETEIGKSDPNAVTGKAKLVSVVTVSPQNFTHYIELQGKIDAENISYVTPRGGPAQVRTVYVKKGDYVKKGQLLLKLDDAVMLQNLSQLETQLAYAKNIYQRQKNLWDQGIGTEVQYITAKNNVEGIEKQISTLKETWNMSFVRAEMNGVADEVNIHAGETFTGSPQAGIKIINMGSLKAVTDIPENYLNKVRRGTPVQIVVPDLNNRIINSTISLISQSINQNSRGFLAEARIPYNPSLKPNQVAIVKIQDYAASNVIVVPVSILQTDETGKYTFVLATEKGKQVARKRPVTAGEVYGEQIEIKQGLNPGDQIITLGYQGLYDGQVITTQN